MEILPTVVSLVAILSVIYLGAFPFRKYIQRKLVYVTSPLIRMGAAYFIAGVLAAITMVTVKLLHDLQII